MKNMEKKYAHIKGWNIDANPEDEPNYPMKSYNGADHKRLNYKRPELQEPDVEVLHSNERPGLTAVFGTSSPPAGLSGLIRRFAFSYSEGSYGHWLPLLLADRVNMVEGVIDDITHGHIPDFFAERGWGAEWKYNRRNAVLKLTAYSLVIAGVAALITRKIKN